MALLDFIKLPEIKKNKNIDDASRTLLHAKIIQQKLFLKKLYIEFYNEFKTAIPSNSNNQYWIEIGSGGGFIKKIVPNAITSDILKLPNVNKQFSALKMPFRQGEVDAFFMVNVLHHINESELFFKEIDRCLKKNGKLVMVDMANTLWSRFVYQNFHHEPFDPNGGWSFRTTSPLSGANGAMPWIIFYRDRSEFEAKFPRLKIIKCQPHTPFRYLISGGLTFKQLLPAITFDAITSIEKLLSPLNNYLGMFYTIEIKKI